MKISIVTPVYNAERTIARTIESIRSQKDVETEQIIVDGASSDGTLNILKKYESGFSAFISEADKGIYDAINKGIQLATGDIIGILNADDYYASPDILAKVSSVFKNTPIDAVFGDLEYFHEGNVNKVIRIYRSKHFKPYKLSRGLMPAHPSLFLRRGVYEKYGLFKRDYKIAGDFEFVARIFKDEGLTYSYLPITMVRMQLGGISTQGLSSTILLNKEILRACRENGIKTNYFRLLSRYPRKLMEFLL